MERLDSYEEELVYQIIENKNRLDDFIEDKFVEVEQNSIEDDRLRKTIAKFKELEFISGIWADDIFISITLLSNIQLYVEQYPALRQLQKEQVIEVLRKAGANFGIDNILIYCVSSCGYSQIGWEQVDEYEWRVKVEMFEFITLNKASRFIIEEFKKLDYVVIKESLDDTKARKKKYLSFRHKNLCIEKEDKNVILDHYDAFLKILIQVCLSVQSFERIRYFDENGINTYIRDLLKQHNFKILDQTLRGTSYSGKSAGEVDIFVETQSGTPLAIIEAMKLNCINKSYIDLHINKVFGYDANGLKVNIILIYAYAPDFRDFYSNYIEYIKNRTFDFQFIKIEEAECGTFSELRVLKSSYLRSGMERKLYHVFINLN